MKPTQLCVLVLLVSVSAVEAWFRVACTGPLVQDRIDPVISPGTVPSNHIHTVHGASNFMTNSTFDSLRSSNCTSCKVTEDLSNYWFPKLYFQDPHTKLFEVVDNGGLLVYYQNRGTGDAKAGGPGLQAFPPGFKMTSGNPRSRSKKYPTMQGSQDELRERAIEWACLRYPDSQGYNGNGFPTTDCEAGLNARIHMPSCWDGKNIDSPDHISHTAYLSNLDSGSCPPSHPVPLMTLFYEVTWDVHAFASRWQPGRDSWPFTYSTGDPTGYSWHGDFQNGWDVNTLQNAINSCDNTTDPTGSGITEACPFFTVQSADSANACKIAPTVKEDQSSMNANGTLKKLPGCNPIQAGPDDATLYDSGNCPADIESSSGTGSGGGSDSGIDGSQQMFCRLRRNS